MTVDGEAFSDRIASAITSQKQPTVTVLSTLLAVQDEIGYLTDAGIEAVATYMKTTSNDVFGVASFYGNFRFTPPGDHVVEVCWGPTCHLLGAPAILQGVLDHLGLSEEGETEDNRFSFKYNTCLGACSQAPVMSIDHRLIGRINIDRAIQHIVESVPGT